MRYTSDPRKVVHEMIDGELILIQLESGNYYSVSGAGPEIWAGLEAGLTAAETAARIAPLYADAAEGIEDAVAALCRSLAEEGLLEPAERDAPALPPLDAPAERRPFAAPVLEKYTDMQDFLLVDPVHEVGAAGWPATPAA